MRWGLFLSRNHEFPFWGPVGPPPQGSEDSEKPRAQRVKPDLEPGINYLTLASKIKKIVQIAEIYVSFFGTLYMHAEFYRFLALKS